MSVWIVVGSITMFCVLCSKLTKHNMKVKKHSNYERYECDSCGFIKDIKVK